MPNFGMQVVRSPVEAFGSGPLDPTSGQILAPFPSRCSCESAKLNVDLSVYFNVDPPLPVTKLGRRSEAFTTKGHPYTMWQS